MLIAINQGTGYNPHNWIEIRPTPMDRHFGLRRWTEISVHADGQISVHTDGPKFCCADMCAEMSAEMPAEMPVEMRAEMCAEIVFTVSLQ